MFRFYKTILNLKTRLQEQNLKKALIFLHYHSNLFICCKTELKIKFIFYRMHLFYRRIFLLSDFFLTELHFLKGDTNILNKYLYLKIKKRFCKNHTYFFLKNIIFFQLSFATFEQPYLIPCTI